METPFIGQIGVFSVSFTPRGWAECDGRLLPINGHEKLFSLIGTTYGGDGQTSFALPDLRGRAAIMGGAGPGLTDFAVGATGGRAQIALSEAEMPSHTHHLMESRGVATSASPAGQVPAEPTRTGPPSTTYRDTGNDTIALGPGTVGRAGGGQPHDNLPA